MVKELMLENLKHYENYLEELKLNIKKINLEIKTIEKAKKTISKLDIEGIEFSIPQDDKNGYLEELEKELKLLTSIIRRYKTLLSI